MCSILLTLKSCIYKIKLKTNPYTAFSIDNDAHIYYWDIQGAATFFPGVKCRGEGGGQREGPEQVSNSRQHVSGA